MMKIVKVTLEGTIINEEDIMTDLTEVEACEACELLNEYNKGLYHYYQVVPE